MIIRAIYLTLAFCFLFIATYSQTQPVVPIYTSKNLLGNSLEIASDSGRLAITACSANAIYIQFFDNSDSTKFNTKASTQKFNIRVTQNLDDVFFATDSLWVIVNKFDLSIRFLKKQDEEFLMKNQSYFLNNQHKEISFSLQPDDKPTLANIKKHRFMQNRISRKNRIHNLILISPKGYALLIENPANEKVAFFLDHNNQVVFKGKENALQSFYFLSGGCQEIIRLKQGFRKSK